MKQYIVILTGASRGLGAALAAQLLRHEIFLVTISRTRHPHLEAEAVRCDGKLDSIDADLSDCEAINSVAQQIRKKLTAGLKKYWLINNAGTTGPIQQTSDLHDAHEIMRTFNVNVVAAITLSAHFINAS